jgi:hypothetical protein
VFCLPKRNRSRSESRDVFPVLFFLIEGCTYDVNLSYVNKQFQNLASESVVKNTSGDLVKKVSLPILLLSK